MSRSQAVSDAVRQDAPAIVWVGGDSEELETSADALSPTYHVIGASSTDEASLLATEFRAVAVIIDARFRDDQHDALTLARALRDQAHFGERPTVVLLDSILRPLSPDQVRAHADGIVSNPIEAAALTLVLVQRSLC